MNTLGFILVFALVAELAVASLANLLNLRALKGTLPDETQDVFSPERYRASQRYTTVLTWSALVSGAAQVTIVLIVWFAGGFNMLNEYVTGFGLPPVPAGLLYIGILIAAWALLFLPLDIYRTFVIEARFGFNRTTARTFAKDRIIGAMLAAVIGGPVLAAVIALFEFAGGLAWLYAWAGVTLFTLGLQYIAPSFILPLFNRYESLEDGEVRSAILDYARSVDFSLADIYVMDGSRRSTKSNAFFTGYGRTKRIALFDTLLAQLTPRELVAVVAHEVGHYKLRHIWQGTAIGVVQTGAALVLLSLALRSDALFDAFFIEQPSVYAGLVVFSIAYTPLAFLFSIPTLWLSRRNEAAADQFAVHTGDEPAALARGLKKLATFNLSNLTPHPFYVILHYTHPPLKERLKTCPKTP